MHKTLVEEIEELRRRVARMTARVQGVVEQATQAVFRLDITLAHEAVNSDKQVDIDEVEVEKLAISMLGRQQPMASDLRFITSVIKVNGDFERIGDCAVNIAQRVPSIVRPRNQKLPPDLLALCNHVVSMLRDTVNAFNLMNVDLANRVLKSDDAIDAYYHQIVQDTLYNMETDDNNQRDPSFDLAVVMIAKNYERIGDHCTNIAEDIIFIGSGQIVRHKRGAFGGE